MLNSLHRIVFVHNIYSFTIWDEVVWTVISEADNVELSIAKTSLSTIAPQLARTGTVLNQGWNQGKVQQKRIRVRSVWPHAHCVKAVRTAQYQIIKDRSHNTLHRIWNNSRHVDRAEGNLETEGLCIADKSRSTPVRYAKLRRIHP
jgi:hypothetical protein